jgi:hypothetical protein
MERIDPEFTPLLRNHNLPALTSHSGSVYGIWADFRLAYLNPGWFRFAAENGGEPDVSSDWTLGRSILESMPERLRRFYRARYADVLRSGTVWTHRYECSSDDTYRVFRQVVCPLGQGGLLISNSVIVSMPHDSSRRPGAVPDDATYRNGIGTVSQCGICRRVQNQHEPERWDWVPAWVRRVPEGVNSSICPVCVGQLKRHAD